MLGARRFTTPLVLILVLAAAWRLALAAQMPCISRDGVNYSWQARELGRRGAAALRVAEFDQHPLYALTILGLQRGMVALGAADTPLTWQRAGQSVAWLAGMAVVVLSGLLARRAVRRLNLPVDADRALLFGLALAALLPLNTWLSADVMSDQLHLALYLAAAAVLLHLRDWRAAAACGVLSGLAFLTRPEGAVVCAAAVVVLLGGLGCTAIDKRLTRCVAVLLAFLLIAAPYWLLSGRLTPKAAKETIDQFRAGTVSDAHTVATAPGDVSSVPRGRRGRPESLRPPPAVPAATALRSETLAVEAAPAHGVSGLSAFAALVRRDVAWFAAAPLALYETFRAGRVVIPLLAIPPLIVLRRQLRGPVLLGLVTCLASHFALTCLLLTRHGYLAPRHTLPVVALLLPFAAIFLAHVIADTRRQGRAWVGWLLAIASIAPLAAYSLRVPNYGDAYVARAARWLIEHDPDARNKLLLGGASQRRIAFYADMRWQPWPENTPDADARYAELRRHIVEAAPDSRPDYLAIETGPGAELAGNAELLQRLLADPALAGRAHAIHTETSADVRPVTLHVASFDWASGPSRRGAGRMRALPSARRITCR